MFNSHYTDLLYRKKYHGYEFIEEETKIYETELKSKYDSVYKFEVNKFTEDMKYHGI